MLKNKKILTFIVILTTFGSIFCATHILFISKSIAIQILNYLMITYALTTFVLMKYYDAFKMIYFKIVADHIFIIWGILLNEPIPGPLFFYLIIFWIHSIANICIFDVNTRLAYFLKIMSITIIAKTFFLFQDAISIYLYLLSISISLFIIYSIEQFIIKQLDQNKTLTAVKKIQKSMVIHNVRNHASSLYCKIAPQTPELSQFLLTSMNEIVNAIESLSSQKKMISDINKLCKKMTDFFKIKYNVQIKVAINSMKANVQQQLFLSSLYIFISNACEANAKEIKITQDNNKLLIEDNGSGFDVSKLKSGFTTKSYGHGQGLIMSIEACKKDNIDVSIESKIGIGTKIVLDFEKNIQKLAILRD